jgi:hypothetical protein
MRRACYRARPGVRQRALAVASRGAMEPVHRRWGSGAAAWLLLALVLALVWQRSGDLRSLLRDAAPTRGLLQSDDDFHATPLVLGDEVAILRHIRSALPPGTPVAVTGDGPFEERRQRFWIALLPEHPIASNAPWLVCPVPCGAPGDAVVARGRDFVLLRRAAPGLP